MLDLKKEHPQSSYTDKDGYLHISDEDASVALIKSIDLYSQRMAIYHLVNFIKSNQKTDQIEITKIENMCKNASGTRSNFLIDELVNSYHFSVYYDSTYSMAILGMIAPTIESLFYEIFVNIGELMGHKFRYINHDRLCCIRKQIIWDCHFVVTNGKAKINIVEGVRQLAEITGLNDFLPVDYYNIIDALVTYRNMMFHNGLEWQTESIGKFKRTLDSSKWPKDWFDCSRRNNAPWIYYMTTNMIQRCLQFLNEIEIASGSYFIEKSD